MAVRSDALFYEALIREICEKAGITPVHRLPGAWKRSYVWDAMKKKSSFFC